MSLSLDGCMIRHNVMRNKNVSPDFDTFVLLAKLINDEPAWNPKSDLG